MLQPTPPLVTKASGELEPFEVEKLRHSLTNAGAPPAAIEQIIAETLRELQPGMSTKKIYRKAYSLLKRKQKPSAARYKLKQSLLELGPSGFPFERLVGALLEHQGYSSRVGQFLQGRCIGHEVDVVAERGRERLLVECKYHNHQGRVSDVKVALYIKARFEDIWEAWGEQEVLTAKTQGALVYTGAIFTNTRFTADALQYGECAGLQLVSWDFPRKGNLRQLIDASRLYPLTSLTSLTRTEEKHLLEKGLVLGRELVGGEKLLLEAGVPARRIKGVLDEIEQLCG